MKNKSLRILVKILFVLSLTFGSSHAFSSPIDDKATTETTNLFNNLKTVSSQALIYGQHHAYLLGSTVDLSGNTSDTHSITGSHPGIVGFDFVRHNRWSATNTNSVFHRQVRAMYSRGGIATFSWHAKNPATGGGYKDVSGNPVQKILTTGSTTQATFNEKLDEIAGFFNTLELNGVKIPVIWRPFHENTGSWFWWGAKHSSPAEFKALWQYTVKYLRDQRGVHNVLWAYSPSKPVTVAKYLKRYPGDNYVDVIGFDRYGDADSGPKFAQSVLDDARLVVTLAEERGKIAAITESGERKGFANTRLSDWFSRVWLQLENDTLAKKIAYVLTWNSPKYSAFENGTNAHLYNDFINFYNSPFTWFEDDLPDLYGSPADLRSPSSSIESNTGL